MKISWLHLTLLLLALCVLCTHCGREDREHRNRNRNRNRNRDREHRRHRRMERRFRRLRLRGHRRALPDPTTTTTTTTPLPTTTTEAIMNRPDAFQVVSRRMRYPSNDPRSAVVEYGKLGTAGNRDGNYETQLRNFLRTMQTSSSARTETEAPETEAPETEVQTSSEADVDEDHGAGTEEYDDYLWEARWRKRERWVHIYSIVTSCIPWWCRETLCTLLALCEGNLLVIGGHYGPFVRGIYWLRMYSFNKGPVIIQIAMFMGPTWGSPGSCRPQMDPMSAPWTLLSGQVMRRFHVFIVGQDGGSGRGGWQIVQNMHTTISWYAFTVVNSGCQQRYDFRSSLRCSNHMSAYDHTSTSIIW